MGGNASWFDRTTGSEGRQGPGSAVVTPVRETTRTHIVQVDRVRKAMRYAYPRMLYRHSVAPIRLAQTRVVPLTPNLSRMQAVQLRVLAIYSLLKIDVPNGKPNVELGARRWTRFIGATDRDGVCQGRTGVL